MNEFGVIDYRDEFYLKAFRRWYVVKVLSANTKFSAGIPLPKAAFVDFLLSNPPVMHRLLLHFKRAEPTLNLEELLYQDNLEFGGAHDIADFSRTCVLLISRQYLKFRKQDGEIYLMTDDENPHLDNVLSERWKREIVTLQPILSKSLNVLISAAMGVSNGN